MEPNGNENINEASGTSIFWALVALALNAMTQPSRIGILLGAGTVTNPNSGFDPLRSSPVLCAAETLLDIFFFIFGTKAQRALPGTTATPHTTNTTKHRPVAAEQDADMLPRPVVTTTHRLEPNTDNSISSKATLKVLAFFLGVLPQAIKLFSMRGIVGTQICAAMFLAASVARPISCRSPPHFAASIDVLKNIDIYTAPRLRLLGFAMIAHPVVYVWLYFNIATANDSNSSFNILFYITLVFIKFFYTLFAVLTVIFNLVWRRSLPLTKWLPLFVCLKIQNLATPTKRSTDASFPFTSLTLTISLITSGLIISLLVSVLCIASGRLLTRVAASRVAWSDRHLDSSLPTISINADESGSMGFSRVIDALKHRMACLKAVFMNLCQALDNHGKWLRTWYKVFGASSEQIVLACGIFNLLTAVLYYLVVFDSMGTSSPSWTSVLG